MTTANKHPEVSAIESEASRILHESLFETLVPELHTHASYFIWQ